MGLLTWLCSGMRSMENPRRPLDPWSNVLGESEEGSGTLTGVRVSNERAHGYSPFWRAMNLISGTVAKLPLGVFRRTGTGVELDTRHPAHRLLRREPNEAMTPFVWKQTMQAHAQAHGNGYSYIMRRGDGAPVELLLLDPERTYPLRENGQLWYVHQLQSGEMRKLHPYDVLHLKGYGFNGLEGYSLLQKAKESLGLGVALRGFASTFFRNNARPNTILVHPGRLSAEARKNLRESWERMHSGFENAHRTAILEEGMQALALSINATDAQLLESRQFSLIEIANEFGIPPHKLGAATNTSYKSLEQENQAFLDDTMDPWLVRWEEECEAKLLSTPQRDRGTHCISFDRSRLVIPDKKERGEYYTKGIASGWLSIDDVRGLEGLNPLPEGLGGIYYRPANLLPINADPDGPKGPAVAPGSMLLPVPDLRQDADYDCGPAAVQSVCQHFGVGPSARQDYIDGLDTTARAGTKPDAIMNFLARNELVTTASGALTVADLARFFALGWPVLCPIQAGEAEESQSGHWVVVVGTGLGQVFVQDPAQGLRMFGEEEWLARWHDVDAEGLRYERFGIAVGAEVASHLPQPQAEPKETPGVATLADDEPEADLVVDSEPTEDASTMPTATEEVAATGDVQGTALNGAQITALLDIANRLALKQLPPDGAQALIEGAFPLMDKKLIDTMIQSLSSFTPATIDAIDAPESNGARNLNGATWLETLPTLRRTARQAFSAQIAQAIRRVGRDAERAASKPKSFLTWLDQIEDRHFSVVADSLSFSAEMLAQVEGRELPPREVAHGVIENLRANLLEVSGRATGATLLAEVRKFIDQAERDPLSLPSVRQLLGNSGGYHEDD